IQKEANQSSSSNNSNSSNGVNTAQGVNTANRVNTASSQDLLNEPKTKKSKDKFNEVEPESVRKNSDAPIIKDWVLDDEEEDVEKQEVKPSIKRINFVKATTDNNPRKIVKNGEPPKQNTHRKRAKPKATVNAAKAKANYNAIKGKRGNVVKASK
nr:hypothetical protein [Tanacetum cinerariifolium]